VPAWNELLDELIKLRDDDAKGAWLVTKQQEALAAVGAARGDRNAMLYGSAFLSKPDAPGGKIQITHEDINGLMAVVNGMDFSKGLTLLLHTPGGQTNATETIVSFLRAKFEYFEVIVPTFAMSAGTMISLAADTIVMGRQSQLGPIDPQMPVGGRYVSARAIVEQFDQARTEILADPTVGLAWAPVLQSMGPALLVEAQNALDYGEQVVGRWLASYMCKEADNPAETGASIARYFNDASTHKSHGRRIGREEARSQGVKVEDLEDSQQLQDDVLTAYHLMCIGFEQGLATKVVTSGEGRMWIKNWASPEVLQELKGGAPARRVLPVKMPSGPPRGRKNRK
jgi:hypothetical protein